MGHIVELSDEQYETLRQAAEARGETPEQLIAETINVWREEQRDPYTEPRYYETDDWLRHLGMSDSEIAEVDAEIAAEKQSEAQHRAHA